MRKPIEFLELKWNRETNIPKCYFSYRYRLEKAEDGYWVIFKLISTNTNEESYRMISSGYSLRQAINYLRDIMEES